MKMPTRPRLFIGLMLTLHAAAVQADTEPAGKLPLRPPQPPASLAGTPQAEIEVWVDLSVPALGSLPSDQHDERDALRRRITRQQDEVMAQLVRLGAVEIARVQQVRNAIAVRLPATELARARAIAGVRNVRPVQHIERKPP